MRISVVAALIERDGRLLICQRRKGDVYPLKWEFPGGKIQSGETPPQALTRELEEELGVRAVIGPEIYRTQHTYDAPHREVDLLFFVAELGKQEPRNLAFEQILWVGRSELQKYDFLEADRELIARLGAGTLVFPPL